MIFLINLLSSFLISLLAVPVVRSIGIKNNYFDRREEKKDLKELKVRIGGLAILISFLLSLVFIYFLFGSRIELINTLNLKVIIISSVLISIVGIVDDIKSLSPLTRLIFEILISSYIWAEGIRIDFGIVSLFDISFFDQNTFLLISFLLTILWIVGLINAINWIDGLDGLACGASIIYLFFIFIFGSLSNNILVCILSTSLIGSNLGFLKYNLRPAKIIMGDGGSYFNGFLLSILGLLSVGQFSYGLNFLILLLLFFIPIVDMINVIISRLINNKSPFIADRNHIHQRLIDKGINQDQTVNILYFFSIFTCSISLIIFYFK